MSVELHHRAVVADTHNDLLMAVTARPPDRWASFFVREVLREVTPPCCEQDYGADPFAALPGLSGLSGTSGLPLVTDALLKHGFADEEITKIIGGNVHRLFRAELGRAR
ncbi:membrane dipeptidase [Streptosporangium sp. NPDC000563]|uniref:membrane dipeptidase n=1 Tax=Streptosporangium sp. NPDC000563 TaxID=3154366 RepID=UPI0033305D5F